MNSIAHIRESDNKIQSVEEHLHGVKRLAEEFGEKIGVKHITGLAGLLHDMGKYTNEFREYILEAVRNPDSPPKKGSVDHSTAGGKMLYLRFHTGTPSLYSWVLAEIVGNAIISHHSYLHDFLSPDLESKFLNRVRDKELMEFNQATQQFFDNVMNEADFQQYVSKALLELEAYLTNPSSENDEGRLMFLTKYVFSALIDGDRTNTREFEENKLKEPEQNRENLFADYYEKLMAKINDYQHQSNSHSRINLLRREMSDKCDRFAEKPPGIYTLSIPTGGGKTLASLRYGLKHAIQYRKQRIIFVVPYTTIIEQNAEEIRGILKDDGRILEHHSNIVDDADDEDEHEDGRITARQKLKLAKENWDSPIIFTTMVQFLDVVYAKSSRNIRRLHNLCESIIIFDEVQKVPVQCVTLFNHALNLLKTEGHSSLILCTATQPALDFVEHKLGIEADAEMIDNLDFVIAEFTRVQIIDQATEETFDNDKLADFVVDRLGEVHSVLVILNTKSVVKRLYLQLEAIGFPVYQLSTSMCATHRSDILCKVKGHLTNNEKVVCISTQLIEAGVDVSFECVIRSLAGLDSIAQAAGRCNRHGEYGIQRVYVIAHAEENLKHLPEIKVGKEIAMRILIDLKHDPLHHGGNILSTQAMNRYFQEFYKELSTSLDYFIPKLGLNMTELLMSNRKNNSYNLAYQHKKGQTLPLFIVNSYRTAAENFHVIENHTTAVIVPYGEEGKDVIAKLNGGGSIENFSQLLRQAQRFTVNLFKYETEQLDRNGGLVSLLDGQILALKESAYNEEFGLDVDNDGGFSLHMFGE